MIVSSSGSEGIRCVNLKGSEEKQRRFRSAPHCESKHNGKLLRKMPGAPAEKGGSAKRLKNFLICLCRNEPISYSCNIWALYYYGGMRLSSSLDWGPCIYVDSEPPQGYSARQINPRGGVRCPRSIVALSKCAGHSA